MLTHERERLAEALAMERMHGKGAAAFVAGRIADLKAAGDSAGVERWVAIGEALDALTKPSGGH